MTDQTEDQKRIAMLEAKVTLLSNTLLRCADQFQDYAMQHLADGKTEKAATNQAFADEAYAALMSNTRIKVTFDGAGGPGEGK